MGESIKIPDDLKEIYEELDGDRRYFALTIIKLIERVGRLEEDLEGYRKDGPHYYDEIKTLRKMNYDLSVLIGRHLKADAKMDGPVYYIQNCQKFGKEYTNLTK